MRFYSLVCRNSHPQIQLLNILSSPEKISGPFTAYSIKFTVTMTITTAAAATVITATDNNDYNENKKNGTFRSNL